VRTIHPDAGSHFTLDRPRGEPASPRLRLLLGGIALAVVATAVLLVLQLAQH